MSFLGSLFGGAVSSGLNALSGFLGSAQAYHYNRQLIQMQQDWQEKMSNSAHQREVADLRKAGLNPILSATGGSGASFGSASAPGMSVDLGNTGSDAVNSALAIRQQKNTNKLTEKNIEKTDSDISLNNVNKDFVSAQQRKVDQDIINSMAITRSQIDNLKAQTRNLELQNEWLPYSYQTARIHANASMLGSSTSASDLSYKKRTQFYENANQGLIGREFHSGKNIINDLKNNNYVKGVIKNFKNFGKYGVNFKYYR